MTASHMHRYGKDGVVPDQHFENQTYMNKKEYVNKATPEEIQEQVDKLEIE